MFKIVSQVSSQFNSNETFHSRHDIMCFDCGKEAMEPTLLGCCSRMMCAWCVERRVVNDGNCLFCLEELNPEEVEVLHAIRNMNGFSQCEYGCGLINRCKPWIHHSFCTQMRKNNLYSRTILPATFSDVTSHVKEVEKNIRRFNT